MSEAEGPEKRIGSVIKGKWTLEALLGVGGMASVYAASHRNGQRAALKVLHADFARDKVICERFLREGYVSNKIGHPATVAVLDDDRTEDDSPFLVMELLEGHTVRELWKQAGRRLPIPQSLKICDDILDCLVACHAIGVIHRDLKPANIFVTHAGVTKVLDFGVAQMRSATSERTATGTALGTPAYMSPEQAMGLVDQLDGRADLFSVGAMLHALTTGQRINNGRTENEALIMAATTPVPSVARIAPDLPIELIQLIDKSLQWDRRNRHSDARDMQSSVRELLQALSGERPPEAAPQGAGPHGGPRRDIEIPFVEGEQPIEVAPAAAPVQAASPSQHAYAPPPPPPQQGYQPPQQGYQPPQQGYQPPQQGYQPPQGYLPQQPGQPQQPGPRSVAGMVAVRPQSRSLPAVPGGQGAPTPEQAAVDDPRADALRDLFKRIDRVLPSVRQFGWEHPATDRTMHQVFDGFTDAISKDPAVVDFTIRPYSFLQRAQTVWEPGPPFDSIPYNLFACGIRGIRMQRGLTFEELKDVLTLMLLDPTRDLPPEDDLAAAFWEKGFAHVQHDVVDAFAEGGAAEREAFYGESDALERLAADAGKRDIDRIEARAMVVSTDKAALAEGRSASPFALDVHMRELYAGQLVLDSEAWSERYVDAITDGYIDAAVSRDAPLVLASLRKSSGDLVVAGRLPLVVRLHDAIVMRLGERLQGQNQARLASALTNALFGGETLDLVLKALHSRPEHLPPFEPILDAINPAELPRVLHAFRAEPPRPVQNALLRFIVRSMRGQEPQVAAAAIGVSPDSVNALLGVLARANTNEARQALHLVASNSEDINVKLEARALMVGEPATNEIAAFCEHAIPMSRMAAFRTLARYRMKNGWPVVARVVKAPDFNERGQDERLEAFRALVVLSPERGEPMAIELAKKGGVFVSEGREATRIAAIDALGELSRSPGVVTALREIAQARWGTAEETRAAANEAANRVAERLGGVPGDGSRGAAPVGAPS